MVRHQLPIFGTDYLWEEDREGAAPSLLVLPPNKNTLKPNRDTRSNPGS